MGRKAALTPEDKQAIHEVWKRGTWPNGKPVSVTSIADQFRVSWTTIRRALDEAPKASKQEERMTRARTVQKLSYADKRQVEDWLRENKARWTESVERFTARDIASAASAELNLLVSHNLIRGLAPMVDLDLEELSSRGVGAGARRYGESFRRMQGRVAYLEELLHALVRHLGSKPEDLLPVNVLDKYASSHEPEVTND